MKTLSIVVPCYNEEKTVEIILQKLLDVSLPVKKEIIIVDDCSQDKTLLLVHKFIKSHPKAYMKAYSHKKNRGKGAALHTGFIHATGDYTVIQDADLEYDPAEFTLLLKPLLDDVADVVYGSRFRGSYAHRILFFWHTLGNKLLTFTSNIFTNLNLTDMETCYKMFKTDILQSLTLTEKRFGFEPEVTAKISRIKKIRLYEVGISYYGRTFEEGKKINWKDGVRALYVIIKYGIFK